MVVAIVGSRSFDDYALLCEFLKEVSHLITEIISGGAPGADSLGEQYANEHQIPFKLFPADWDNISTPNARVKKNRWGVLYNANAGKDRNRLMAEYLKEHDGVAAACWDGRSPGTAHMIECCHELGVQVFIKDVGGNK